MARRSRTSGRTRQRRGAPAPQPRAERLPSRFDLRSVQKETAPILGPVLHQEKRTKAAQAQRQQKEQADAVAVARHDRAKDRGLNLQRKECKSRPTGRRSSGGAGRKFVPWCK